VELAGQWRRPDSNGPPARRGQSSCGAAVARVARPPIVRDAAREDRRDIVPRRRGSAVRAAPWGVQARGGRPRPQPRSGVARGHARALPEDAGEVQV